jgi:hypothetical protein
VALKGSTKKLIAAVVAIVLIVISISVVFYLTRPLTVQELYRHSEYQHWEENGEFRNDVVFHIKDTVVSANVLKFPEIIYPSDNAPENVAFDLTKATILTFVTFESAKDRPLGFMGNATERFKDGNEVSFSFKAEDYSLPLYFGSDTPRTLIEPVYASLLASEYNQLRAAGYYPLVNLSTEIVDAGTRLKVTMSSIGTYFPIPFYWGNVSIMICEELPCINIAKSTVHLYRQDDTLLGVFESGNSNSSITSNLIQNQYLLIAYQSEYKNDHFILLTRTTNGEVLDWGSVVIP